MEELNKSLKNLEKINNQEKIKKEKYLKKKEKIIEEKISHSLLKMHQRRKNQFEYKERLKKKKNKKIQEIPENFNVLYDIEQTKIFNKEWKELPYALKLNRIYIYLKIRKKELKWNEDTYEEKLELLLYNLNTNKLKNNINIEYNIEKGKIIKCHLIEK